MALKAVEGSTSSDVLEKRVGVSTAGSTHKRDQSLVTQSPLPRHSSESKVGARRGIWDVEFLTD